MSKPKLYLFIGAPGAGKTTTAEIIADATGAVHLWADAERHKLFGNPTHSLGESTALYETLNARAEQLLADGKSVVFDTNFNFYADRHKLAAIAARHNADTLIIWMNTPLDIAKSRAVGTHERRNGYAMHMTDIQFEAIVSKLEPPMENEKTIKIDGTRVDSRKVIELLQQPRTALG